MKKFIIVFISIGLFNLHLIATGISSSQSTISDKQLSSWADGIWPTEEIDPDDGCDFRAKKMLRKIKQKGVLEKASLLAILGNSADSSLQYQCLKEHSWSYHVVVTYVEEGQRFIIDPMFKNKVFRYIDWLRDITHKVGLANFRVTIDDGIDKISLYHGYKISAFTSFDQQIWAMDAIDSIDFNVLYTSTEIGEKSILEKALFMHHVGDYLDLDSYYEEIDSFNDELHFLHKKLFPESKTKDYISEINRLLEKFKLPDNVRDLKSWQREIKFQILDDLKQTKNTKTNEDLLDHCCAGFNSMLSKYCSNLQCWQEKTCPQHAGTNLPNPI